MKRRLNSMYDLLRADGSIVINKNLMFSLGVHESIIYCELISKFTYFETREELTEDGFFFNTVDDLYLSTGLGAKTQKSAIKKLKDFQLIEYKVKGMPPKRHFKIANDTSIVLDLIEKGREQRDILKEKLRQDARTSKLRLLGGIKTSNMTELIPPNGSVNNTKPNNTNINNTKERYIILPNDEYACIKIYKDAFTQIYNKEHMKVSIDNYELLKEWLNDLDSVGIEADDFAEGMYEYFEQLPNKNDGSIISFMYASKRIFDTDSPLITYK